MITFNNKVITINNDWLKYDTTPVDPYNPLGLPPYTIRLKYTDGVTPTFSKGTGVQVSSSPNVWDLTYENNDWWFILLDHTSLIEVLGANTTGVINMQGMLQNCSSLRSVPLFDTSDATIMEGMFHRCSSLTTVPLFDTSNVNRMGGMFFYCSHLANVPLFNTSKVNIMRDMLQGCSSLTSVPLFDTSKVTNISGMLYGCWFVKKGALSLYQQASTQANPPIYYGDTFTDCGKYTTTGLAELQQIPTSWGGLKEE